MKFDKTERNSTKNDMRVCNGVTERIIFVEKCRKYNKNSKIGKNENKNSQYGR